MIHPESGTTTYHYNGDGSLDYKLDAKNQKIVYGYDSEGRVTSTRRYAGSSEYICDRVDYYYNSQSFDGSFSTYASGRLAATASRMSSCSTGPGQIIEMYAYNAAGAVTKKRLRMVRGSTTVDKDVTYTYTSDGKLETMKYPGAAAVFTYSYDLLDRPIKMTGPVT